MPILAGNGRTMLVTYALAYIPGEVELCDACVAQDDHECGALGQVQIGAHNGYADQCDGANHGNLKRTRLALAEGK